MSKRIREYTAKITKKTAGRKALQGGGSGGEERVGEGRLWTKPP